MGYYDNKYMARAFFLCTSGGYRYTLPFGLFGDITLGLGYQLSFHPSDVFKLNADGEYEKVNSPGRSAFLILGSVGIGYDFGKKTFRFTGDAESSPFLYAGGVMIGIPIVYKSDV